MVVSALLVATTLFSQWSFQLDTTFRTEITQGNVSVDRTLSSGH